MFLKVILLQFSLNIVFCSSEQSIFSYGQDPVLRRYSVNSYHDLQNLWSKSQDYNLDVWQITDSHIDIYYPKNISLPSFNAPFTEWSIPPISEPSQPEHQPPLNLSQFSNSFYHESYHPLSEIEDLIEELSTLFPLSTQVLQLGMSAEMRNMLGIKVSKSSKSKSSFIKQKTSIVIMAGQHAREWISISTALYIVHSLLSNASEPYSLAPLLKNYDFYIIPVANPDGYVYTWDHDRLWSKNRQILSPSEKCVGIDLDRNWGYKWKSKGPFAAPRDPCNPLYSGARPFQSPEVNNIANYIATLPNVKMLLDLHSYGQTISSPFSYSCKKLPKDAENQLEFAFGAARSSKIHGTSYTIGSLCSTLYKTSGSAIDWLYKRNRIKYSYAVYLRDTGTYGFALPPKFIRPVGEETIKMVEYLAKFII